MGRSVIQSQCGVTLRNITVTDLDFTNDVFIPGGPSAFSSEAKALSLEAFGTKARIQAFGGSEKPLKFYIC